MSEPTAEVPTKEAMWRSVYLSCIEWMAWFLEKYDLAEDVTPPEVDDVIRSEAAARALAELQRPGTRLIRASENLLDLIQGRAENGDLVTYEWGEPEDGVYSPTMTRHTDDNLVARALAEVRERVEGLEAVARVARALLTGSGDADLPPDEEWDPVYLDLREALAALDVPREGEPK